MQLDAHGEPNDIHGTHRAAGYGARAHLLLSTGYGYPCWVWGCAVLLEQWADLGAARGYTRGQAVGRF